MSPKPLKRPFISHSTDTPSPRPHRALRSLRSATRAVVGIVVGLYLGLLLLLALPPVQDWLAQAVGRALAEKIGSRVEVRHVDISLTGGLVVDGLSVWDRSGEQALRASRVAVKIDVGELLTTRRIRIDYAQLMGTHANIYQAREGEPLNIQYIIDAFRSRDTTSHPIDLAIGRIVIRRSSLRYEQRWRPATPARFNPARLHLTDLNLTAQLRQFVPDSVDLSISRLSAREASGLTLQQFKADLLLQNGLCTLQNLSLQLPSTTLVLPRAEVNIAGRRGKAERLDLDLAPRDLAALLPRLGDITDHVRLTVSAEGGLDDIRLRDLRLSAFKRAVEVEGDFRLTNITRPGRTVEANVRRMAITVIPATANSVLPRAVAGIKPALPVRVAGHVLYSALGQSRADVRLTTALGALSLKGSYRKDHAEAHLLTSDFNVAPLLKEIGHVSADLHLALHGSEATVRGRVPYIDVKGYRLHDITANVQAHNRFKAFAGRLSVADRNLRAAFEGSVRLGASPSVEGTIEAPLINLDATRLLPHPLGRTFALSATGHVNGHNLMDLEGRIDVAHFAMTDHRGTFDVRDVHLSNTFIAGDRHLTLSSPYIEGSLTGQIEPKGLGASLQRMAHIYLPSYFSAPAGHYAPSRITFRLTASDLSPIEFFAGRRLPLPPVAHIEGSINTSEGEMSLHAVAPSFAIDSTKTLRNIDLALSTTSERMQTICTLEAQLGERIFALSLDMSTLGDHLEAALGVDQTDIKGRLALAGDISRSPNGHPAFDLRLAPTTWHIGDKVGDLSLTRAHLRLAENLLYIDSLGLQRDSIYLMANGVVPLTERATASLTGSAGLIPATASGKMLRMERGFNTREGLETLPTEDTCVNSISRQSRVLNPRSMRDLGLQADALQVDFGGIDIEQIMTLAGVKPVSLSGQATGHAVVTGLPRHPVAEFTLHVPDFLFNGGQMGQAVINGSWGRVPDRLTLDATMHDTVTLATTTVHGAIAPYKAPRGRIDLDFTCQNTNLHFLNRYTSSIFSRAEGRASGTVGVHGQFGQIDLSGDILAHRLDVALPFTGTSYYLEGDSVHLRPEGVIEWRDATMHDRDGHTATVSGQLRHHHFKNMTFDVGIHGNQILAYDFDRYADTDLPFFGTIYATGDVRVKGRPGQVNIDIEATPTRGSMIEYNVRRPDAITQSSFLTIGTRDTLGRQRSTAGGQQTTDESPSGNMNIAFTLDLTPDLDLRLLMDPTTEDYITLRGRGPIHANYYNKGGFTLYGDYAVESGRYQLNIASIAQRREFQLLRGGTVSFTGQPLDAEIALRARYDVPARVALADLSSSSTFSDNKVPVSCLIDVSGQLRNLQLAFDIDLPNATEDERQLVRSQISTEEERYTQFIYLLALGRFYTFDYTGAQQQSVTAINSILSSTLSSQINQVLSGIMNTDKWTFGANLSTGEDGWRDVDVEGQLTGSLFNDRLIVNGNLGYRDRVVNTTNTNFVGDFDARYLLTRNGNISIKAYSETNDRYFTKSSLTTQGIGIMAKKDFSTWRDLFTTVGKKRKKKK